MISSEAGRYALNKVFGIQSRNKVQILITRDVIRRCIHETHRYRTGKQY